MRPIAISSVVTVAALLLAGCTSGPSQGTSNGDAASPTGGASGGSGNLASGGSSGAGGTSGQGGSISGGSGRGGASATGGATATGGGSGLAGMVGAAGKGGTGGGSGGGGKGGASAGAGGMSGVAGTAGIAGTRGTGGTTSADAGTADASPPPPPPPGTTPPVTPRWAFEPWAWEDNTNTRQSTESLITGYLSRQIPVGAVIIDSPWETTYNTLLWDTTRYPSPAAMISGFHAEGVKVVMWLVAIVDTDAPQYQTVKTQGYGVNGSANSTWWKGTGIQIDVTNAAAATWWNGLLGGVLADGIDGWKLDRGADYYGDPIKTAAGTITAVEFKKRLSGDFFDYTTANDPTGIVLVRPYSAAQGMVGSDLSKCSVGWVGDHEGGFGGIATQLSDIYTSAQMGYGAPGVEIGGYVNPAPNKDSLIRYAEFGALTPLMENGGANGGLTQHLPWYWDAQTVTIYQYFATLHSELGSYNFSYEVDAHLTGKSVIRQSDIARAQHLLGDQILASVITTDVTTKSVTFPTGASWIDYWNEDMVYAGGSTSQYSAPLAQYPIFIKAGAIIPLDVKTAITGHGDTTSAGKTTVAIYPAGQSSFTFHRPTGEGTAYSDAKITVDATSGTITVAGAVAAGYRLRVKSMQAPTGVTGADGWSFDAIHKVVVIDKQGATFAIVVAGLKGYP
jgi:alpha-glucosidase (family GH31 glycosyl hydrolase)